MYVTQVKNILDILSKIIRERLLQVRYEKYSMTSVSADNYKKEIKINNQDYDLVLSKILPNASEVISDSPGRRTNYFPDGYKGYDVK